MLRYQHEHVTREAVKLLEKSDATPALERRLYLEDIVIGTDREDKDALPCDMVIPVYGAMPWLSHYWNPATPERRFFVTAALFTDRMQTRWDQAINAYRAGETEHAYRMLGHCCHLLQDMSVPAHVNWDAHAVWDTYEHGYLNEQDDKLGGRRNYELWTAEQCAAPTHMPDSIWDASSHTTLLYLLTHMACTAGMFDSNDASGTLLNHEHKHSQTRERQPKDSLLLVKHDVSYADAKVHANTCMPAAIAHTATLMQYFKKRSTPS